MVHLEKLASIFQIFTQANAAENSEEMIFRALEAVIPFDFASLFLVNQKTNELEMKANRGEVVVDLASEMSFVWRGGLSGFTLSQKNPIVIPSFSRPREKRAADFNSFLSLPLRLGEELVGVLNLGHRQAETYRKDEVEQYQLVASQIALVLEFLRLNREKGGSVKAGRSLPGKEAEKKDSPPCNERDREIREYLDIIDQLCNVLPLMIDTRNVKKAKFAVENIHKAARKIGELLEA